MPMVKQSRVRTLQELKSNPDLARTQVVTATGIGESVNMLIQKISHFPKSGGFVAGPTTSNKLLDLAAQLLG